GGVFDAALPQHGAGPRRQQSENQRVACAINPPSRSQSPIQPERIGGEPEMGDAPVAGAPHQNSKNHRMQMKVEMSVDMVEGQAGRAEPLKLRLDFALELPPQWRPKKVTKAAGH